MATSPFYRFLRSILLIFGAVGMTGRLDAQTQVTIGAGKDNTLYESQTGDVSNGAGQHFFVGKTNTGALRRGLIKFDVASSIPAGSRITDVTLSLTMSQTATDTQTVGLHRATADWGEGTSKATGSEG